MRSFFIASFVAAAAGRVLAGSVATTASNYQPGTLTVDDDGNPVARTDDYQNATAATGLPSGDTGYGALTPFNPAFLSSDIVIIGSGGSLTLKFDAPVGINTGSKLGVFDDTGIVDVSPSTFDKNFNYTSGGTGTAGKPPYVFGGGAGYVSVSGDGVTWFSRTADGWSLSPLATPALTDFSTPTNAYTDNSISLGKGSIGSHPSNYFQPFEGTTSSFAGLDYRNASGHDILHLLNGSAGGTWLDLSAVPLPEIDYVKFDSPDGSRIVLDAVVAVPEPSLLAAAGAAGVLLRRRRGHRSVNLHARTHVQ